MTDPIDNLLRLMSERIGDACDDPEAVLEAGSEAAAFALAKGYASGPLWASHGAELLASYWSAGTGRRWQRAATAELPAYAEFVCVACRDEPGDACGDACGASWADELPPLWASTPEDWRPTCRCCGSVAQLVSPLAAVE